MAKKVALKTLAMRVLDSQKIPYTVYTFPDTMHDAVEIAALLGLPAEQVFKTLVLLSGENNSVHPFLFIIPSNREVDLRQLAHNISVKAVRMAGHDQAEQLTGLKVGGISALALLSARFDVYIDESAQNFDQILVSAGQRGINLKIHVNDLLTLTRAQIISGTRAKE
jgi:Cys-tRNA(Pro)/Cys-tRNA(Cys) deacylase